jgi:hypothetical protein
MSMLSSADMKNGTAPSIGNLPVFKNSDKLENVDCTVRHKRFVVLLTVQAVDLRKQRVQVARQRQQ